MPPSIRVVAYNFLSGGSKNRSGHWSRLTRDLKADLVFAQECRPPRMDTANTSVRRRATAGSGGKPARRDGGVL